MSVAKFIDPTALMRVKSLELRVRMVMEGFWKGLHRSPYHGFSVEFSEYRPYVRGDDLRYLDWKVMARTDRAYLKKFEDETNLHAHLVLDRSRSMAYGSGGYTKTDYSATLAATFAYFLMGQHDAVGLTTFDQGIESHLPARQRPGQLREILVQLEKAPAGQGTDLPGAMRGLHALVRKRGFVVLFSDFLAPIADLEREIGYFAAARHELAVFQLLDRRELDFSFDRPTLFRDSEDLRSLFVDPAVARAGYLERLHQHLDAVKELCARNGISYRLVPTDEPLEKVLFEFVRIRG